MNETEKLRNELRKALERADETKTSVENVGFRHLTRRLENAASSKSAELIESLAAIEELNDRILAAIEEESEAVFERVRKRLPPKCS